MGPGCTFTYKKYMYIWVPDAHLHITSACDADHDDRQIGVNIYICLYIIRYICNYAHTHTHVYMFKHIHTDHTHTWMGPRHVRVCHVCIHFAGTHICMRILCMYIFWNICICVCVCVFFTYAWIYVYTYLYTPQSVSQISDRHRIWDPYMYVQIMSIFASGTQVCLHM